MPANQIIRRLLVSSLVALAFVAGAWTFHALNSGINVVYAVSATHLNVQELPKSSSSTTTAFSIPANNIALLWISIDSWNAVGEPTSVTDPSRTWTKIAANHVQVKGMTLWSSIAVSDTSSAVTITHSGPTRINYTAAYYTATGVRQVATAAFVSPIETSSGTVTFTSPGSGGSVAAAFMMASTKVPPAVPIAGSGCAFTGGYVTGVEIINQAEFCSSFGNPSMGFTVTSGWIGIAVELNNGGGGTPTPTPTPTPAPPFGTYDVAEYSVPGGHIHHVHFSNSEPARVYAAAFNSGWKSEDNGNTWSLVLSESLLNDIVDDPNNADVLYAASRTRMLKSVNRGASWDASGFTSPGGVRTIYVQSGNPITLWVAVVESSVIVVKHSNDGGATWTSLPAIPTSSQSSPPWDIAVDPTDATHIFVGEDGHANLWRTFNSGGTWVQAISVGGGRMPVSIAPSDHNRIYTSGAFSTDGGNTWDTTGNPGLAWSIITHPATGSVAYYGGTDNFHCTVNGGTTWNDSIWAQTNGPSRQVEGLAINSTTDVFMAGATSIFQSTGALTCGIAPTETATGLKAVDFTDIQHHATGAHIAVTSDIRGFHISTNGGTTFSNLLNGTNGLASFRNVIFDPLDQDHIIVGHESKGFVTTDGGLNWGSLPDARFPVYTWDYSAPSILYYGTNETVFNECGSPPCPGKLYRSIDGGASWTLLSQAGQQIWIDPLIPARIFTINNGSLMRSDNRGNSWATVSTPTTPALAYGFDSMVWLPGSSTTLFYIKDTAGVYKSTNSGVTWNRITTFTPVRPREMTFTADGSWWVVTVDSSTTLRGIWRSGNQGSTWQQISTFGGTDLAPDTRTNGAVWWTGIEPFASVYRAFPTGSEPTPTPTPGPGTPTAVPTQIPGGLLSGAGNLTPTEHRLAFIGVGLIGVLALFAFTAAGKLNLITILGVGVVMFMLIFTIGVLG